jgi:hypothetical protein
VIEVWKGLEEKAGLFCADLPGRGFKGAEARWQGE